MVLEPGNSQLKPRVAPTAEMVGLAIILTDDFQFAANIDGQPRMRRAQELERQPPSAPDKAVRERLLQRTDGAAPIPVLSPLKFDEDEPPMNSGASARPLEPVLGIVRNHRAVCPVSGPPMCGVAPCISHSPSRPSSGYRPS